MTEGKRFGLTHEITKFTEEWQVPLLIQDAAQKVVGSLVEEYIANPGEYTIRLTGELIKVAKK